MLDFWLGEMESKDLQKPPPGFKEEMGKYLQQLEAAGGDLAKIKAVEAERFRFMAEDLARLRREKICRAAYDGRSVEGLLFEDESGVEVGTETGTGAGAGTEAGAGLGGGTGGGGGREGGRERGRGAILAAPVQALEAGRKGAEPGEAAAKKMLIRMLGDVPSLVGADLKTYGPYKKEDVALLPAPNAEALIKRGMAVEVTRRIQRDESSKGD